MWSTRRGHDALDPRAPRRPLRGDEEEHYRTHHRTRLARTRRGVQATEAVIDAPDAAGQLGRRGVFVVLDAAR